MPSANIETIEERTVLVEALNLLKEKYDEIEEQGGNHVRNARHRKDVADTIAGRLPAVKSFPNETENKPGDGLVFFANAGTSFKEVTSRSYLGTRKAGDIKVGRRFRVDLSTSKLEVKESYYFGDYCARQIDRDFGRVENVKRHTSNPLWFAKKDGKRIEDYCQSFHMGAAQRDDEMVSKILAEDSSLTPHVWRTYKRDVTAPDSTPTDGDESGE